MKHNAIGNRTKGKLSSRQGMTLVELLVAVAIVVILCGVAFVFVIPYQRSLAQVERDGIAKEIFVAAQNHLTAAQGQGYLSKTQYGTEGTLAEDEDKGVYYYVVTDDSTSPHGGAEAFSLMLPFGSIDETVRTGGSYLIRYQPGTATVMDVFYCSTSGSPRRFNCKLNDVDDVYTTVMGLRDSKSGRRTFEAGSNSVLGYYGGEAAAELTTLTLKTPTIEVINAEKLKVIVGDPNSGKTGAQLQLIVEGLSSGAKIAYSLSASGTLDPRVTWDSANSEYEIVLDDITTSGMHFCEIVAKTSQQFISGEDIKVYAVAYSNSALSNIAYSESKTTNSLFELISDSDGNAVPDTAYISNIRHLENLDGRHLSGLGQGISVRDKVNITHAEQTTNLSWPDFQQSITGSPTGTVSVYYKTSGCTQEGGFSPVTIEADGSYDGTLDYDGKGHSISGIKVFEADAEAGAGLFGTYTKGAISNLELLDFDLSGTASSGALAGQTLLNTTITNVVARNTQSGTDATVKCSSGSSGGLIGETAGSTTVTNCAASVVVSGKTAAGGLIGTASASTTVTGCYSGGHTDKGEYYTHDADGKRSTEIYNVTATDGTAGGLIGVGNSAEISSSYSTCSVSGSTAGGFVGSSTGKMTDCYCTGLVSGDGDNAFIGSGAPASGSSGNKYYKIVNEMIRYTGTGADRTISAVTYKGPGATGIAAIDTDTDSFNEFVGGKDDWTPAEPYDTPLGNNYGGQFNLKTVGELGAGVSETDFVNTHYGDWPSPELFFENTPS